MIWLFEQTKKALMYFSATILLCSCVEEPVIDDPVVDPPPPYASLEKQIRSENDWKAVFTWDQYTKILTTLSDKKFLVLPINEMRSVYDSSIVVVGLRHDIDMNPFKALEMADIEKKFNFRSTYYVLATADYYGTIKGGALTRYPEMDYLYKELFDKGEEIGIHNDLLTVMIIDRMDPLKFMKEEVSHYASIGIPVFGTAAHGSPIARELVVSNFEMFKSFATKDSVTYQEKKYPIGFLTLKECGLDYEAYHVPYNIYLSEAGGKWNDPHGLDGILATLKESKPGDRIVILAHPDWWGKKAEK
jgi:hypothetical protein